MPSLSATPVNTDRAHGEPSSRKRVMVDFPETSHSLLARIKDLADGTAWSEFLGIYQPVVYRMARRRGLQDADAQDVTQQVFLSVSNAIGGWVPGADQPPFRAWLVTITRNAVTKALSRRKPDCGTGSSSIVLLLHGQATDEHETTAEFVRESRLGALRWAAEQIRTEFSAMTWRLFWETVVLGKSVAEVAADTGRTPGAIYMARFKILERLKQKTQEVAHSWDVWPREKQ